MMRGFLGDLLGGLALFATFYLLQFAPLLF